MRSPIGYSRGFLADCGLSLIGAPTRKLAAVISEVPVEVTRDEVVAVSFDLGVELHAVQPLLVTDTFGNCDGIAGILGGIPVDEETRELSAEFDRREKT